MTRSVRAVIFDMDGVVVDTEQYFKRLTPGFMRRLVPDFRDEDLAKVTGKSNREFYNLLVQQYGYAGTYEEFFAESTKFVEQIYRELCALTPGVRPLLASLRQKGLRIALASSAPKQWVAWMLDRFQLSFDAVVSSDDVDGRAKPAPDIFLEAARRLGIAPANCVVVEDSTNGIKAARRAGMLVIGHRYSGNEQRLDEADAIVTSLSEILKHLNLTTC